ncbi:MAG: hypothetical protein AAGG44_17835 [Planctomycetota bacterium]
MRSATKDSPIESSNDEPVGEIDMASQFPLPHFLKGILSEDGYTKWLHGKAKSHLNRDRKRGNLSETFGSYRRAIHQAVERSCGRDAYTNEALDWTLVRTYNNIDSRSGGRAYKAQFSLLPTVDHLDDGSGKPAFEICSWRTNDSKNDLSYADFLELCKRVVAANQAAQPDGGAAG